MLIILVCTLAGIAGWLFDIEALKRPLAVEPAPQGPTVVTFLFVALALLSLFPGSGQIGSQSKSIKQANLLSFVTLGLSVFVSLIGSVNLRAHLCGLGDHEPLQAAAVWPASGYRATRWPCVVPAGGNQQVSPFGLILSLKPYPTTSGHV